MKIAKQVVVITGGASGMGKACAQWLTELGARVVIWDKSCEAIAGMDVAAMYDCDVRSEADIEKTLSLTIEKAGVPRIGINCAGIATAQRIVGKEGPMPLLAFQQVIEVNLVGTFNVMRVLANAMSHLPVDADSGERGVIINTASVAAYEGQIGQCAYSASKAGIVGMTLPAARELAQHAIRVNTIAPGIIATPMLLGMPQAVQDSLAASVTFPKRLGQPKEFARLVQHLIENEYLNGEVIRLDGAIRLQAK